ncbi:MAG TPA: SpoIIE family protein phosphatase [Gaiellales bacterium]|nr:SpoIIE family protein phosphatase [Gaiellales bacterium]
MSSVAHSLRRIVSRGRTAPAVAASVGEPARAAAVPSAAPVDIAPNDPIIPYFQSAAGAVDIEALELESPALDAMRAAGVKLVVPLVTQGELIGLLNLGPRLSDQEYSGDDRRLLESLAAQAAPAVRVGQLVREQEAEIRSRERLDQELAVARLIQQNFLPRALPEAAGWSVAADYRPAREVGGDFYDFIDLPDGRLGVVVGDVTDKGVPAALVMAATRSVLRASAQRLVEPGAVLQRVNDHLVPDIPENMFVTCLYGVLELETGRLVFANAGHNLPMVASGGAVTELMARGMPLGLMPGMTYEETEAVLDPGAHLLLYSDGVTEAHDADREMFGGDRLATVMAEAGTRRGDALLRTLIAALGAFAAPGAEQEDDITLVALRRDPGALPAEVSVASEPGNEREALRLLEPALAAAGLPPARLERMKTAVAEAVMNAMEHGNGFRPELPVVIRLFRDGGSLVVDVTDRGSARPIPAASEPDLEAKLAGEQTPRGWGLFLIRNMVDELEVTGDDEHHTTRLAMHLEGDGDDNRS